MGIEAFPLRAGPPQCWSHVAMAALPQVSLEKQALDFTAFVLLLRLDLMERKLERTGGSQPALEQSELDIGGSGCRSGVRGFHLLTVLSP